MRVFIADDSEVLRSSLIDILGEIKGIEIVGYAENFKETIEAVECFKADVLILDIRMPGGNGILALEAAKKLKKPPIVIMFTNFPYLQYRKRCLDRGADFFFYKAVEFNKLIDLMSSLVLAEQQDKNFD